MLMRSQNKICKTLSIQEHMVLKMFKLKKKFLLSKNKFLLKLRLKGRGKEDLPLLKVWMMNRHRLVDSLIAYQLQNQTSIQGLIMWTQSLIGLSKEWIMWSMAFTISMLIITSNALGILLLHLLLHSKILKTISYFFSYFSYLSLSFPFVL